MRSIGRLLVVATAILAFSVVAPAVSADSHQGFHLDKTCLA
jgi:hypothetical protein